MMKKDIAKTKLFRMVQSFDNHDAKFCPKIADCREAFNNINRNVFGNKLRMPSFRLLHSNVYWGECIGVEGDRGQTTQVIMKINKSFLSKRLFIDTVAHEMVHQWEWLVNETMSHGPQFFLWRKPLLKYNITLNRGYSTKQYRKKIKALPLFLAH